MGLVFRNHKCLPVQMMDDIISLNFCYRNEENKNIIFALEISKDNHVSDLESELAM